MAAIDASPRSFGIYGIPEVARYLAISPPLTNGHRLPTTKLRYWIHTSVTQIPPPSFPTQQRLITFLDLVSMRMIAILRSRNVKLNEIRQAEAFLRKEFGLQWPLASRDLWTHGSDVFIKFEGYLLAASKYGQQAMDFIRDWLREVKLDMTFDANDLASSWSPYDQIRLDPNVQFGAPCIDGTRIPTRVIWSRVKAGDSLEITGSLYELSLTQVQNAILWEKRLYATDSRAVLLN